MKLQNYSIMPLIPNKLNQICEDIERQVKDNIASIPLFCMTLTPIGTPPRKETEYLCDQYDLFREKLAPKGIKTGFLVQASIGHGYHLPDPSPFTKYVELSTGKVNEVCCPYDPAFRAHFRAAFKTMTSHKPDLIMLDDDFRLMFKPGRGCACSLHMAEFNRRAGLSMTREELWQYTLSHGPHDPITKIYIDTQIDALVGCAKEMRAGIDEINPALPGVFCSCGPSAEGAVEIAKILAGKGNPVTIRFNNGNYTPAGARNASNAFLRAAIQHEVMKDQGVDSFLAETDTCPHLRYSTPASSVHTHFVGTILEGASGAKHWITDLQNGEIENGEAYRKILSKYAGFYETLADVVKVLSPIGCRAPVSSVPFYYFDDSSNVYSASCRSFVTKVLERLGLPLYFSSKPGGIVFLDGNLGGKYTKEDMDGFFKTTVVLDSDAAASLIRQGYGDKIGIRVENIVGDLPGKEYDPNSDIFLRLQKKPKNLVPIADGVVTDSEQIKPLENGKYKFLCPGVTRFKREGGETIVFSGTPDTAFDYQEAFSFLSAPRKRQFLRMLKPTGCLPVYYPGDAEVYLRAGTMPDGSLFCGFFNIGLDAIDEITLAVDKIPVSVKRLSPEGKWIDVPFTVKENIITVHAPANILLPEMLLLK